MILDLRIPTELPLLQPLIVRPYVLDTEHKDRRWLNRCAGVDTETLPLAALLAIAVPQAVSR